MGLGQYVPGMRAVTKVLPRRKRDRERVAFVLSGGGVLGSVQVGQLEALLEADIVPDFLVGASVGGLNAAAIASDPTLDGVAHLRAVWSDLRTEDLFPGTRVQRAWHFVRKGDHLYPNTGIRRLVDMIPARRFEQMAKPLSVVAANLRSGREHWFDSGPVAPAIIASTALPGIFPPVLVDGELFVDGGVVNNVPISRAVELGATRIYVLTCGSANPQMRPIRRPLDVLMQAVAHSRAARVQVDVSRFQQHAEIEMLPMFETGAIRFNDLSHTDSLIEKAREATRAYLSRASAEAAPV